MISKVSACIVFIVSLTGARLGEAQAQDKATAAGGKPKIPDLQYVKMSTSMGDIVLELNYAKAPITAKNFLDYTDSGFYDGTIFHRVINSFMIQGGGFGTDAKKKTTKATIKNEWQNGLKNDVGTISMARIGGNPDSATSQFFINVVNNGRLDQPQQDGAAYAVFGKVMAGMEVVNKIKAVKTQPRPGLGANAPVEQVVIQKVSRIAKAEIQTMMAEAAKRAEQAKAGEWQTAMEFVKGRKADPGKGSKSATGLWHVDMVAGEGASPAATDRVKVHYTGWLVNGKKFDSSVDRGSPATFGLNQVIKGWTEGLSSMKVGGKRILVIPPELGYGSRDGGTIPANSTLIFEVELLDIVK